jgi:hypothetical protein
MVGRVTVHVVLVIIAILVLLFQMTPGTGPRARTMSRPR